MTLISSPIHACSLLPGLDDEEDTALAAVIRVWAVLLLVPSLELLCTFEASFQG